MSKRVDVIRHLAFEDLGSLEPVLIQRGFTIRYWEAGVDDLSMLDPLRADLLVVLGGPIGVYEDTIYPFLILEAGLLRERLTRDLPTLGICLGAQLMAAALGARVYGGPGKEIGWSPLIAAPGAALPAGFRHLLTEETPVLHWHGDTFDLPPGAERLAGSRLYPNQAFLWKRHGLALQFHAEVRTGHIERWLIGHAAELAQARISVPDLRAESRRYGPGLEAVAASFWKDWLESWESGATRSKSTSET